VNCVTKMLSDIKFCMSGGRSRRQTVDQQRGCGYSSYLLVFLWVVMWMVSVVAMYVHQ
jgi:hypothetical protein